MLCCRECRRENERIAPALADRNADKEARTPDTRRASGAAIPCFPL